MNFNQIKRKMVISIDILAPPRLALSVSNIEEVNSFVSYCKKAFDFITIIRHAILRLLKSILLNR